MVSKKDSTFHVLVKSNSSRVFMINSNGVSIEGNSDSLKGRYVYIKLRLLTKKIKQIKCLDSGVENGQRFYFRRNGNLKKIEMYERDKFKYIKFSFSKNGTPLKTIYDNY
ncbi:hypothetical protein D3C87_180960 [compost metagenome]